MKQLKLSGLTGLLMLLCQAIAAQTRSNVSIWKDEGNYTTFGVKAGVNSSFISGLQTTILSEPYFINYTMQGKRRTGALAGLFVNYRFKDPVFALYTELMYAQQGSDLVFNNIEKDFNYRTQFKYQYINVVGMLKFYPLGSQDNDESIFHRLNLGVGPQLGFPITPEKIVYQSGGSGWLPAFGTDLEQQQQLRNVLKNKTNFGILFNLGYEIDNAFLTIDFSYFMGLSDVVETQANSYNFIENRNVNSVAQVTIGLDIASLINK